MSDQPPQGWYPNPEDGSQERFWNGSAWTTETRALAPSPPPAPLAPPPAPAAAGPDHGLFEGSFSISESGRNGKITFEPSGLQREIKKTMGRDDRQFIPYNGIQYVQHDRKSLKKDVVTVGVGATSFEWKIKSGAGDFVTRLNAIIAQR